MRNFGHRTAVAQKNAALAEDLADFREGDRVMTIDGVPGRVTGVLFGPYAGTESYQVELDNGMGGGDYAPGQLHKASPKTSSHVEGSGVTAVATDHTANIDYPELEDILERRLPNENIKLYAAVNNDKAGEPDSSADDSGEKLEMDQQAGEANPDGLPDPELDQDDPDSEGSEEEGQDAKLGDVTMPSACSYCGGSTFGDTQMTGRGVRTRCEQCGGTMKSWGGQWEPEFPNSSQNRASEQGDYRSGGAAGIANAPGAKPDVTSPDDNASKKLNGEEDDGKTIKIKVESILDGMTRPQIAESLQSEAGIVQYLFNKIYERARQRYDDKQIEWWQPPQQLVGTDLAGPAQYHTITPGHVTVGSLSEYDDPDWKWHFTSAWVDVQAKARRFRKEGHVKIVSASKMFVSAEVLGDNATYETQLNYVPGTRKVADWACGCKWASYAWGRSKRYRRFEGRLCSHALATQYEASARGIFGREVEPDRVRPDWQNASSPVVVQYDKSKGRDLTRRAVPPANMRRTFSSLVLDSDGIYPEPRYLDLQHPPIYASVQTLFDHNAMFTDVVGFLADNEVSQEDAKGMVLEALLSPPADEGYLGHLDTPESGSALESEASKKHHKKDHGTYQEHGITWGRGFGPWAWCGSCGGSGCNNCNGTGQVAPDDSTAVGDGGAVDAGGAVGDGGATGSLECPDCGGTDWERRSHPDHARKVHTCQDCGTTLSEHGDRVDMHAEGSLKTADYSTADPLAGMDAGQLTRPTTPHSNSDNPASTGWATSQDPGDWGKSLISNDFGVTFDAALHQAGGRHYQQDPNQIQYSHEIGRAHGYKWAQEFGTGRHQQLAQDAGPEAAEAHERSNGVPGMKYHYLEGWNEGAALALDHKYAATEPLGDPSMTEAAADHLARMFDSTLHDSPEPALPSTTGEDEDTPGTEDDPGNSGQMPGDNAFEGIGDDTSRYNTLSTVGGLTEEQKIIAEFQMTAGARALQKEAAKDFSFDEQQDLINEGRGARARNFHDLNVTGTHYELIGDNDDDETILWV